MGERCEWARSDLMAGYHDREWGVPVRDARVLFEFLILEGAQAGLSWETVLKKRPAYREAFHAFDPERVARLTPSDLRTLLRNPGIIRNRLKIESAVSNARAFLDAEGREGFSALLWSFVGGSPIDGRRRRTRDIPPTTPESDAMSKALKKRGFKFVGSTICYALMQATGMVNDHLLTCPRHAACARLA